MKPFYIGLAFIALAGVAAIVVARQSGAGEADARAVAPVPVTAAQFEGHLLGSDAAPVEVIEYSSFVCGWCARFSVLTMPDIRTRLIETGRVQWKYRDFPTTEGSLVAHHAAACAGEQGRFYGMKDQLFYNQGRWAGERNPAGTFREYAEALGLDMDQYEACMDDGRYMARLQATRQGGQALGVNSTPTFIISGTLYPGFKPFDEFRALVEQAEAEARR
ncbi:MAG: thioredoxin domain-containing protein [Gemmatimonadales bacterium]|jgi:protein-disulfide isomerase